MTHWARPGVKCVCIDSRFYGHGSLMDIKMLVVGMAYTVKGVAVDVDGRIGVSIVELNHESLGYLVERFRPLVTRTQEQDMELFTPLLDVHNHEQLEREFR